MKQQLLPLPIIMGTALVIAAIVLAFGFKNIKTTSNSFLVTGSATMHVTSDLAKLNGSVSHKVAAEQLDSGYAAAASDIQAVKAIAEKYGIKESEITVLTPTAYESNSYGSNGQITSYGYSVTQRIIVSTPNVDAVTKFGGAVVDLAKQGIFFQSSGPEYYYSKLPDVRVKLMGEAVKDAKARAQSIADNANAKVGSLVSVTGGIVQVLAPSSTDVSGYGSYDTSTIDKDVMVTVKAEFSIK